MIISYFKYGILCLILLFRFISACNNNITCLHYGVVNQNYCKCDCFPSYNGNFCEFSNCNAQSSSCGTQFTADMCTVDLVKTYCPAMCKSIICSCGIDSCLNGGSFNPNTCTCQCRTGFYGRVCDTTSKCGTPLSCLNNGIFNNNTCKCDCFSNYNGLLCENLSCSSNDPFDCTTFDKSYCTIPLIKSYCPYLCGSCIYSTSTSTTTTTTSTVQTTPACTVNQDASGCSSLDRSQCTTLTVLTLCPYLCGSCQKNSSTTTQPTTTACNSGLICQNSGVFDETKCSCSCPNGFYGIQCENYNCSSSNADPAECSAIDCSYSGAIGFCPNKCFCSAAITTTTACPVLDCQNSGVFDSSFCHCSCSTGFYGSFCENYNCSSSNADPAECSAILCSYSGASGYCPQKCLCSQPCTVLSCQNNGVFSSDTCVCSCVAGFYGNTCTSYSCNSGYTDPVECNGIDCTITGITSVCPQTCYCSSTG